MNLGDCSSQYANTKLERRSNRFQSLTLYQKRNVVGSRWSIPNFDSHPYRMREPNCWGKGCDGRNIYTSEGGRLRGTRVLLSVSNSSMIAHDGVPTWLRCRFESTQSKSSVFFTYFTNWHGLADKSGYFAGFCKAARAQLWIRARMMSFHCFPFLTPLLGFKAKVWSFGNIYTHFYNYLDRLRQKHFSGY